MLRAAWSGARHAYGVGDEEHAVLHQTRTEVVARRLQCLTVKESAMKAGRKTVENLHDTVLVNYLYIYLDSKRYPSHQHHHP